MNEKEIASLGAQIDAHEAHAMAGWDRLTSRELVERTIEDDRHWKLAVRELGRRGPDDEAARGAIAAHASGRAPPWLIADLLGAIRHPLGCAVLREIVDAPHVITARAAAEGLGWIEGPEADRARRTVSDAYHREDLHVMIATQALAPRIPAEELEALLRWDDARARLLGSEIAHHLLKLREPAAPEVRLHEDHARWASLFERSLRSPEVCFFRRSTRPALEAFVRGEAFPDPGSA